MKPTPTLFRDIFAPADMAGYQEEDNKEDKYVISLYKNTVIDFTQNKISFETNMILMFEDKYNLLFFT